MTTLSKAAFSACKQLSEVQLPASVTSIGEDAFFSTALTTIHIPANVNKIGKGVLAGCPNLETITVDAANTTYDSRENCNAIILTAENLLIQASRQTRIPSTVTAIYAAWMQNHYLPEEFVVPDGIVSIGDDSFYLAGLRGITLPASVERIGFYATYGSTTTPIEYVKVLATTPPRADYYSFTSKTYTDATLYVLPGLKAVYKAHSVWGRFANIVEIGPGSGDVDASGSLTTADLLLVVDYILGRDVPSTFSTTAADVNGDGLVDIADVSTLIGKLL